ncbi:MAG: helix-turn-helix domain-containing protein [Bacteroidota bacterium]
MISLEFFSCLRPLLLIFFSLFFPLHKNVLCAQELTGSGQHATDTHHRKNKPVRRERFGRQIEQTGNDSLAATECYVQGLLLLKDNKMRMAGKRFKDALESDLASRNPLFREKCLTRLALVFASQQHAREARDACFKAFCIAESRGDSASMMKYAVEMCRNDIRNTNTAANLRQQLVWFQTHADTLGEVHCLELLSEYALNHHNITDFNTFINRTELVCQEAKYRYELAFVQLMKSEGQIQSGRYQEAGSTIKASLPFCTVNEFYNIYNAFRILQAEYETKAGKRLNEAAALLRESLRYAQTSGLDELATYIKARQLNIASPSGEPEEELLALSKLISGIDKNNSEEITAELSLYLTDISDQNKFSTGAVIAVVLSFAMLVVSLLVSVSSLYFGSYRSDTTKSQEYPEEVSQPNLSDTENDENERLLNLYNMIIDKMRNEKPYLDPDFSLPVLSTMINRSERYISQAIRSAGGTNFNRMVIGFRVEEACMLIVKYGHTITMNEVGERSGFANRMSFTRRFKEITGMSPTEYLNENNA